MNLDVRFRFNKITGEVEEFVVDAARTNDADHDLDHERMAAEIGRVLELHPEIIEVLDGTAAPPRQTAKPAPADETTETETPIRQAQPRREAQ